MSATGGGDSFLLYGTSACHLCEIAEAMLLALGERGIDVSFKKIDISESDALFERYGMHIPVLQHPRGEELYWPFESEQLREFLER